MVPIATHSSYSARRLKCLGNTSTGPAVRGVLTPYILITTVRKREEMLMFYLMIMMTMTGPVTCPLDADSNFTMPPRALVSSSRNVNNGVCSVKSSPPALQRGPCF